MRRIHQRYAQFDCLASRLVVVLLAVLTLTAPASMADVPAVVQALDVGIAQWRDTVTFQASYRFRQGIAKRYEDAVAGNYTSDIPPGSMPSGRGQVAKSEAAFRYAFYLDSPPVFNRQTMTSKMVSADLGAANSVIVRYWPLQIAKDKTPFGGVFEVSDGAKGGIAERYPNVDQTIPMPLLVCGTSQERPLLSTVARSEFQESVEWHVQSRSPRRTVLRVTLKGVLGKDSWTETRLFTVRTDAALPLIEAVDRTYSRNGEMLMRERTETFDLKDCGKGCLIPARVVVGLYDKPVAGVETDDSGRVWWVRVWESDDVGRQPPGPESFIYTLPEKTEVRGLKSGPSQNRTFNLKEIRPDQLDGGYSPALLHTERPSAGRANWVKMALASAGLFLLASGGLLMFVSRCRKRRRI